MNKIPLTDSVRWVWTTKLSQRRIQAALFWINIPSRRRWFLCLKLSRLRSRLLWCALASDIELTSANSFQMAALKVFRQVGRIADSDFVAMDILPVLWSMCLGPLLNLEQVNLSYSDIAIGVQSCLLLPSVSIFHGSHQSPIRSCGARTDSKTPRIIFECSE